jgi:DNA-binding NarL/FixJ family response regulator
MRVALAEDNALLRQGLANLLRDSGFDVVAEVDTPDSLLQAVGTGNVDVVVTDIRMPPTYTNEGLRAAEAIKRRYPAVGVLVLSQYLQSREAVKILSEGRGVGYLLKDRVANVAELADAIVRVADGGSVVDADVVAGLMQRRDNDAGVARLTAREREILGLMAQGLSNSAIREKLVLSVKTIETHIAAIFSKLNLPPTSEGHRRVLAVLHYLRS